MSKLLPARYHTTNWTACNASLKRCDSLMVWPDPELVWQVASSGRAGRPAVFSDVAIQFCLTLKCMFDLQAKGLAESVLELAQRDWHVPDCSTLSRRQNILNAAITARLSRGGLHLLADSTCVKMPGEVEWKIKRHDVDCRRQWHKVHLGVNAQTPKIRAIEVTDNVMGDAPMLPQLLAPVPHDELLYSVSADGACGTRARHEAQSSPTRRSHQPSAWKCRALGQEPGIPLSTLATVRVA